MQFWYPFHSKITFCGLVLVEMHSHDRECSAGEIFEFASMVSKSVTGSWFLLQLNKPENRVKCTLIPGDGVGPELVYSVQEVFKVRFSNQIFLLGIQTFRFRRPTFRSTSKRSSSRKSIRCSARSSRTSLLRSARTRSAWRWALNASGQANVNGFIGREQGILATPDYSRTGELQTLNMKLRTNLDLFANVVHVRSLPGVKSRHKVSNTLILHPQTLLWWARFVCVRTSTASSSESRPRASILPWSTSPSKEWSNVWRS